MESMEWIAHVLELERERELKVAELEERIDRLSKTWREKEFKENKNGRSRRINKIV